MGFDLYAAKFQELGGIVESWIEGEHKRTPSVQMRVNALDELETISSHEQIMGGPSGQIFLGSRFPADAAYRRKLQDESRKIGEVLQAEGVLGRFSVDWVSVRTDHAWRHYAIEINLRRAAQRFPIRCFSSLPPAVSTTRPARSARRWDKNDVIARPTIWLTNACDG